MGAAILGAVAAKEYPSLHEAMKALNAAGQVGSFVSCFGNFQRDKEMMKLFKFISLLKYVSILLVKNMIREPNNSAAKS